MDLSHLWHEELPLQCREVGGLHLPRGVGLQAPSFGAPACDLARVAIRAYAYLHTPLCALPSALSSGSPDFCRTEGAEACRADVSPDALRQPRQRCSLWYGPSHSLCLPSPCAGQQWAALHTPAEEAAEGRRWEHGPTSH